MDSVPILQADNALLHEVSLPVPAELFNTPELHATIEKMAAALDSQPDGVALAAPQIGILQRIFIVRFDRTREPAPKGEPAHPAEVGVFINPVFVNTSRRRIDMDEGCLSVRGIYGTTYRHERATVRAYDESGKVFERGGGNLVAQIYQHEIDHLEGILFIDHAHELIASRKEGQERTDEGDEHNNHE